MSQNSCESHTNNLHLEKKSSESDFPIKIEFWSKNIKIFHCGLLGCSQNVSESISQKTGRLDFKNTDLWVELEPKKILYPFTFQLETILFIDLG
jgi:hypothetical protein